MEKRTQRIILRKTLFAMFWSIVFFILTSSCCLIYFSSTAYDFADFAMIESVLDEGGQPKASQAEYRDTGAKLAYGFLTMHESDIFLGLFLFSVVVSAFGSFVGILPGTDESSVEEMLARADSDNVSMFALSPQCPNCGAEVSGNFCANCGQDRAAAKELTLANFARQAIPEILNIDRKFFRTLRVLLTKPGFLTLEYLKARRETYTLPTQMYFVIAAAFFLVSINLDLSTEVLLKQPQAAASIAKKAKESGKPTELIQQQVDDTLENYIPFYTFFVVLIFALILKAFYPNWYYVEHLIFSLHFISYFLLLWMVLILIASKLTWLEAIGPVLPLPYLYFALKNVHSRSVGWKFIPISLFFILLFGVYVALTMSLVFFFL